MTDWKVEFVEPKPREIVVTLKGVAIVSALPLLLSGGFLFWEALQGVCTRPRSSQSHLVGCKSNLKNLGTAMEMYSADNNENYPTHREKSFLTPTYLRTIPECPAAGRDTYTFQRGKGAKYNLQAYQDDYFIQCTGRSHRAHPHYEVPPNYPQYNGIVGLIER